MDYGLSQGVTLLPRIDFDQPVNFDLERMKASLNSGVISLPRGLKRRQIRQFIRDSLTPMDLHKGPTAPELARALIHG